MTQQDIFIIPVVFIVAIFFMFMVFKFKNHNKKIFDDKFYSTLSNRFMNFYRVLSSFGLSDSEAAKSLLLQMERVSLLRDLENQVQSLDYKPKIAIIGCYNAGKSSFINSIIEYQICPTDSQPTTSSITKFIYGKKLKIIEVAQGQQEEINIEEYQNICRHPKAHQRANDEKRLEFVCEAPCKKLLGLEIYDSPGFDNPKGDGQDTKLASNIAKNSDIVMVVIDSNNGMATDSLLQEIKQIKEVNQNLICFVVINRADQKPPSAIEKIKNAVLELELFNGIFAYSSLEDKRLKPTVIKLKKQSKKAIFQAIDSVKEQICYHKKINVLKKIDDILGEFLLSLNKAEKSIRGLFKDNEKFWISDEGWSNLSETIGNAKVQISSNLLYKKNKNDTKNNDRGFWDRVTFTYYYDYHFFIDPDIAKYEMLNLASHIFENIDSNTNNLSDLNMYMTKTLLEFTKKISNIELNPYLGVSGDEYATCFTKAKVEAYLKIAAYKNDLKSAIEQALDDYGEELRKNSINRTYEKHIEDIKNFYLYIGRAREQAINKAQKFKQKAQKV